MSLPPYFSDPEDYFEECVKFLREYEKLYNFPNTEILVHDVLDEINVSNLEDDDVFREGFNLASDNENNLFLDEFFNKIKRFEVIYNYVKDHDLELKVEVPLSPKKKHEIAYLAKEIAGMCEERNLDTVVDFGSGLGYLDQLIFEETHLKVLGLECNENHYVAAKKRQRKYHLDSTEKVKYIKHFISEKSDGNIQEFLDDKFGDSNGFCITGLHACADLTTDAINLFLKMPNARAMVIMPCCYHKLRSDDFNENRFKNFPMSKCLQRIYEANDGFKFLRVPFLRLATQPPCKLDEDLRDSVFNLISRAVLQVYAYRHNIKLKRKKRKAVRMKTLQNDFSKYLENAVNGYTLVKSGDSGTGEIRLDFQELQDIWREISERGALKKAAIFILLQNILQPVFENFVLFDRLIYLRENGVECSFKKILDDKISPRCLALVAYK